MKKITPPVIKGFRSSYQNIFFGGGKGGVRKTGAATQVSALALALSGALRLHEIDSQELLVNMFRGFSHRTEMPSADELAQGREPDIDALAEMLNDISAPDDVITIVDLGNGRDAAVFDVMLRVDSAESVAASGRRNAIILCVDATEEAILGTVATCERAEMVLPGIAPIFCGADPAFVPTTGKSRQAWETFIRPRIAQFGYFHLPHASRMGYDLFTAIGEGPEGYLAMDPSTIAARTGHNIHKCRSSQGQIAILLAKSEEEARRTLGFQRSEDPVEDAGS